MNQILIETKFAALQTRGNFEFTIFSLNSKKKKKRNSILLVTQCGGNKRRIAM
jgi:hypothetical protein